MMSTRFLAATLAATATFALVSGVAHAKDLPPSPDKVATDAQDDAAKPAPNPRVRYCIRTYPNTGSMLTRQICMTRADWMREGVDPLTLIH